MDFASCPTLAVGYLEKRKRERGTGTKESQSNLAVVRVIRVLCPPIVYPFQDVTLDERVNLRIEEQRPIQTAEIKANAFKIREKGRNRSRVRALQF